MSQPASLAAAAADLAAGRTTALALTEAALARIADPAGEGARAFVAVQAEAARATARAMDALRGAGRAPSPWAGIPISVKDLFDQEGVPTRAGAAVLAGAPPATGTAPAVARLQRAGFVVLGRTNMVEFAFSGLGVNPHFGTPLSPYDRATGRLPGGSSSGAAVAVADGMGFGALGSDTGGSCRVPAALCGIVGYKPTARLVPLSGVLPLSPSLDSIGPLANTVGCCAVLHALMAGAEQAAPPAPRPVAGLRLGIPEGTFLFDGLEPAVAAAFERAVARLQAAGAFIERFALPELGDIPVANAAGGFAAAESYAWHRGLIEQAGEGYDPRILSRIRRGAAISAADYQALVQARARIIAAAAPRLAPYDAVLCPTAALTPPPVAAVAEEAEYNRINLLLLRNTAAFNFLDGCSISLPCHAPGEAPVGLMLSRMGGGDEALFAASAAVEAALAG
ncbi:amidase [Pseudoroseomonas cervicalis]|uniref:amidase n=1 Tax=Teichococcus cervicalis TaxID=204525 RepID=UPI00278A7442|nr:amidase [Pseudoroseomonas cervicalis]MDQ1080813.1 aspartyl-tRNA(Asn)/glutamyl-tRNA(Gln) amidotransferase subunit A [Pseudoroseomonas cervicalis]